MQPPTSPSDSGAAAPAARAVRAVIFDLDGTLLDSEPNYYLADRDLMARYGVAFSETDKRRYIGQGIHEQMGDMVRRHGLPVTPEQLIREKITLYLDIADGNTVAFPEMVRFLERLDQASVPLAVASGSPTQVIHRLLDGVGLAGKFRALVSTDQGGRGKPEPDVFLEAARRLGAAPADCLVVEDSGPGVEAAGRAGMACIAVPYLSEPPLPAVFHQADLLFPEGQAGFDAEAAWAWVEARLPK